jgi:hypothetical protein
MCVEKTLLGLQTQILLKKAMPFSTVSAVITAGEL